MFWVMAWLVASVLAAVIWGAIRTLQKRDVKDNSLPRDLP